MTMDITTMGMDTITTINHHMLTTQTCPRNPLLGHEKAMLSYNGSMAFLISVRGTGGQPQGLPLRSDLRFIVGRVCPDAQ